MKKTQFHSKRSEQSVVFDSPAQYHAVSLSGGKDSTCMLLMMIEKQMPIDVVLFADTGMEFPEMYGHLEQLEKHLQRERGLSITILRHPQGFEYLMFEEPKQKAASTICIENGYSIVEHPQRHGKSYDQWLGDQKPPTHRERLCMAIDHALEQKPADFDALLMLLHDAGYEVKQGKNPAFRNADQKRFIRLDTLGEGYAKDDLLAILAGRKQHCPRKQVHAPAPEKLNLLIDIQSKLCEGKGVGYARWASIFNLKQMAQTMNYLTEHGLLQYSNLVSKAESATAKYNDLAARIQAAEKRMAEIAVMKTHIINYVKTKDVYAAYRKAGYSKKYLAEHEPDILLHKAAKKAFDEQGMQKLPTIKKLQNEYAELLVQKKRDYAAYRQARDEMRELLKAKANVDRILGGKNRTGNTEKEQAQR